ncbi:MAG TPA: Atxe2 family lasso peptide isopeptidase, partial [Sphingomicrobium sp.]
SACLLAATAARAGISNRELVEVTDIDSLGVSPDGRFAVFRTVRADVGRNSYALRWHSVDLADGTVRDIGSGGDPIYLDPGSVEPEAPVWAEGGRRIIFRALLDGAVGLWQADVIGERTAPLLVRDADIESYSAADGGRSILYKVGPSRDEISRAETQEYDSGILVDSSVDLSQNLFRGGSINGRMSTQRLVGYWFIRDGLLWRAPRQQRRLELSTGADTPIGSPEAPPPVTLPSEPPPVQARSEHGDLATAAWDGVKGSLTATLSSGAKRACADPLCQSAHISAFVWRPASRDVLVTFTDRERRQSLYLWRTEKNELHKLTSADGLLSGGRRSMFPCAVSAEAAFCVASSPASPPRFERIDLETGERTALFDPNMTMRSVYYPTVRYLRWNFAPGRDAAGVLLQGSPTASRAAPLYLNYYLCEGFLRGGEGDEWPIPELLDAGFAVACINSVPSSGPQDAIADDRIALDAVSALIAKLSAEGIVDRSKVAMGGLSHGSEIAMWIAGHSRLLAALSISSGQFEPGNYWTGAVPGSDQPDILRKVWGLGAPDETPGRWRLVSPALSAGQIRSPILFQLPEQEARRIPELYARLARSGTPTELYAYPDEAHIKVQPRHRLAVYDRNRDWFRYWLQDYRDPDPAKAQQYERWALLRARWLSSRTPASATTATKAQARPAR